MSSPLALAVFGRPALPADTLTDQAARWADHVLATGKAGSGPGLPPEYVTRKALDAVAFSLRHGLRDLSVPSKLIGVSGHQLAVEALALYDELPVADRPRLVVSHTLDVDAVRSDRSLRRLGRIQPKHAAWLAPLLGRGAAVHLHRVTGFERRAQNLPVTLGVNVRIAGIARAIDRHAALRERPPVPSTLTVVAEPPASYSSGGEDATLAVRLWRDGDGMARMSCPHVVRHSPTGPEWGYGGSGPADCARSLLLALTDEATADAHYQDFKREVIASLPEHGAVIQRTAVLAWLSGQPKPTSALRHAA